MAINKSIQAVKETGNLPVPLHLRNAPTQLMKELNYGKGYKYAHDYPNNFVEQAYLPEQIENTRFYEPGGNPKENQIRQFLKERWKKKYGY
jgi:putative ATPase